MAAGDQRTLRDTSPSGHAVIVSPSDTVTTTQGRAILINCTSAGTVKVGFPDASTLSITLTAAGVYEFNWAIVQVFVTGTSATATYYNLW